MQPTLHLLHTPAHRAVLHLLQDTLRVLIHRAHQRYQAWLRRRRALAHHRLLLSLDDALLRDLGLDRSELLSIATHPGDPERARAAGSK
jgi:uncharacterized protein YjiS (DUF1127 family)